MRVKYFKVSRTCKTSNKPMVSSCRRPCHLGNIFYDVWLFGLFWIFHPSTEWPIYAKACAVFCKNVPNSSVRVLWFEMNFKIAISMYTSICRVTLVFSRMQRWYFTVKVEPSEPGYYLNAPMPSHHIQSDRFFKNAKGDISFFVHVIMYCKSLTHPYTDILHYEL